MIGGMGNLGMGVAFTLHDHFSDTSDKIEKSMGDLSASTEMASSRINAGLKAMFLGAGMMAAGGGLLSLFGKPSDVRAEFEGYELQIETLVQSKQRAADIMASIKKDALDNPVFGTKSLVASNAALMSTGTIMEEQSRRVTNNLANILAGVGKGDAELIRMSANLNGIASLGKATGQDIKQFIYAGIPIFKILQDATGLSQEAIEKNGVSLKMLDKAFQKVSEKGGMFYGATERMAQSSKGLKAAMEDGIETTMERIGIAIEPITVKFYKFFGMLINKAKEFISTPLGQTVVRITYYLGLALVAGGALVFVIGALSFASGVYTKVMMKLAQTQFYATYTSKGLRTALWELVAAEYAALAPVLMIVAGVLLFVAAGYLAWNMIDSGNDKLQFFGTILMFLFGWLGVVAGLMMWMAKGADIWGDKMDNALKTDTLSAYVSGLNEMERTFAGIWGVISAVKEIWDSWNGTTFTLTEATEKKLNSLGLLDFVLKLSTYVVRFKEFLKGMWDGIVQGFSATWATLKESFDIIWQAVKPLLDTLWNLFKPLLKAIGVDFGKLTGDVSTFKEAGRIVGLILTSVFGGIAEAIKIVAFIIGGLIDLFRIYVLPIIIQSAMAWWEFGNAIVNGVMIGWSYIKQFWNFILALVAFLWNLPSTMLTIGISIIQSLWEGMKSMWANLKGWFEDSINWVSDKLRNAWSGVKDFVGLGDSPDNTNGSPAGSPTPVNNGARPAFPRTTSKTPAFAFAGAGGGGAGNTNYNPTNNFIIQLDGDDIAHKIDEKKELKNARK